MLENETTKVVADYLKDFGIEEPNIDLLETLNIACSLTQSDVQELSEELLRMEHSVPSLECTEQLISLECTEQFIS